MGSFSLRPALLLLGNSRPRVTTTPLPHATGAYGQLPRRDFNPLDLLLLLRTLRSLFLPTVWNGKVKKKDLPRRVTPACVTPAYGVVRYYT
jgi:hypothetical protein